MRKRIFLFIACSVSVVSLYGQSNSSIEGKWKLNSFIYNSKSIAIDKSERKTIVFRKDGSFIKKESITDTALNIAISYQLNSDSININQVKRDERKKAKKVVTKGKFKIDTSQKIIILQINNTSQIIPYTISENTLSLYFSLDKILVTKGEFIVEKYKR